MKRRPSRLQIEKLARRIEAHIDQMAKPHPVVTLEMPPLPEKGWTTPRIFFVGEMPAEVAEMLADEADGLPGWPSTPEVMQTIAAMVGDAF